MNTDQRHQKRVGRFQALFAYAFEHDTFDPTYESYVELFRAQQAEIDELIRVAAPDWPLQQMNQVDLAVIRMTLLEHRLKKTPVKVLLDEAIIIAKKYGSETSSKFVNGVLGKILIDSMGKTVLS